MTDAQRAFADEYLLCLNATQAYKKVYTNIKNDAVAATSGGRLLRNVEIAAYIEKRQQEDRIKAGVSREMLLQEIAAVAFSDLTNYVTIKGGKIKLTDTDKLTPFQRKALGGVKKDKHGAVEIKLQDKLKALDMTAKLLGFDRTTAEEDGETGIVLLPPLNAEEPEDEDDGP